MGFVMSEREEELRNLADEVNGSLEHDNDGPYIRINTGDNTSKENYDDLISMAEDIDDMLVLYRRSNMTAEHDTQIIEFELIPED